TFPTRRSSDRTPPPTQTTSTSSSQISIVRSASRAVSRRWPGRVVPPNGRRDSSCVHATQPWAESGRASCSPGCPGGCIGSDRGVNEMRPTQLTRLTMSKRPADRGAVDLQWSPADRAFRDEVRAFPDERLPPGLRRAGRLQTSVYADHEASMEWQRILHERGWAAPAWPVEYGGCDWTLTQHYIFERETTLAGAPSLSPMGIKMVAHAIIAYGTQEQKDYFLRSEEHTSELQSRENLVCRLLLEKKKSIHR